MTYLLDILLEIVLPLALVELLGAVVWRLVVVEGRLSARTLEGEAPLTPADDDDGFVVNWEAVEELQEDVAALTQRVRELELEQEQ